MAHLHRSLFVVLSGAMVLSLLAGCSDDTVPSVAATVAGEEILSSATITRADQFASSATGQAIVADQGYDTLVCYVLSYQIKLAVLEKLAAEAGVSLEPVPDEAREILGQLVDTGGSNSLGLTPAEFVEGIEAGRLSQALARALFPNVAVAEDELQAEFAQSSLLLGASWRVVTDLAVFSSLGDATAARAAAATGIAWPDAAAQNGGVVGQVSVTPITPMPSDLMDALHETEVGATADAVQTGPSQWTVGSVVTHDELPALTFEEVRGDLVARVQDQKRKDLFFQWFGHALADAGIEVDPHFGWWNPDALNVEAPT